MRTRDRSLLALLLTTLVALIVGSVVLAQTPAVSRAAVTLSVPAAAAPGGKVTVQVRVAKGVRGKAVIQVRRGTRWVDLASARLSKQGRAAVRITVPAKGGLQVRAKVGNRTSKARTIKVRPGAAPTPKPSPTETLPPEPPAPAPPSDEDPRCQAKFGNPKRVLESAHRIRPLGFPQTQPWAVLCRLVRVSAHQEYGCYATDPGTKIFDVFWYYEHAITASGGVAGRAPTAEGEILTGVLGDASFYIEQVKFDQFHIVWARDGEYDDDADIVC